MALLQLYQFLYLKWARHPCLPFWVGHRQQTLRILWHCVETRSDPCCFWEFKSIFWPLKGLGDSSARLKTRNKAKTVCPLVPSSTSNWCVSPSENGDRSGVRLGADLELNEAFFFLLLLPRVAKT